MTRSQCDTLSSDVLRIYSDMEDEILRMIAAQIGRDGDVSDTSRWRIRQLARSGQMNAKTAALIASYTGAQADAVYDTVLEAAKKEISYLDEAVQAANESGIAEYFSDVPAEDSALFAARAFQEQAANDLNLVNTVMQYKANSTYVNAINGIYYDASKRQAALDIMGKGAAMAVSGQTSLQEATRRTIHNLAQKGIPAFVDKRGREWSPEAYVMMDMRSTLANTARAAQNMRCDQYGINLIAINSYMGARPKCALCQGRVFSRDDSSGVTVDGAGNQVKYSPLSQTSYGEPDGIFGINCGHIQIPFIPGVNIQRYFPYDEEKNAERYEEFQRQRAMERDIKATKRECMMLQAAGDEEGLKQASQKLRQQKQKYNQFCNDKNLGTHYDRTQVYGYDRSKSAKTVWAERKAGSSSVPASVSSSGSSSGTPFQTNIIQNNTSAKTRQLVVDKPAAQNGEKQIFGSLTNGGGSGTMKSRGYDFLEGVIGSDKITQDQSKKLDEIISVIPQKHLDVIEKTVKEVEIVPNRGRCSYFPDSKKLVLDPDKMNGSIVHEFGHVLADAYDIYNDKEFLNILVDGLDLKNGSEVKWWEFEDIGVFYWIENPKFIDKYQGRVYVGDEGFDYKKPINPTQLQEYFSVAFDAYFNNPELLKGKDKKLFDYLERVINNG